MSWSIDYLTELSNINSYIAKDINKYIGDDNPAESMLLAWCILKMIKSRSSPALVHRMLMSKTYIKNNERIKSYKLIIYGPYHIVRNTSLNYDNTILELLRYAHKISAPYIKANKLNNI